MSAVGARRSSRLFHGRVFRIGGSSVKKSGGGSAPVTPTTWNPADKNASIVLSNGNLTATNSTATDVGVRATNGRSASGKWYFECTVSRTAFTWLSLLTAADSLSTFPGSSATAWGLQSDASHYIKWHNNVSSPYIAVPLASDVIQIAVDLATGNLWFGVNNTWLGGGSPALSTSPDYTGVSGILFPEVSPNGFGSLATSMTANFGATAFAFTPPAGFSAWG